MSVDLHAPPYARDKFPRWDACADCKSVHLRTDDEDTRCAICRTRAGLPPLSVPPTRPWYELMTTAELEAIRAKHWTASEIRTNKQGETYLHVFERTKSRPGTDRPATKGTAMPESLWTKAAAWYVEYPSAAGGKPVRLMVGKLIPHSAHGMVFLHAAGTKDRQEGQGHRHTDCPVPVDTEVAAKLATLGVTYFYGYDRDAETLYRATVADICRAPAATYTAKTIRSRYFLSIENWVQKRGVTETLLPDGRSRELRDAAGKVLMPIPYVHVENTILLAEGF